MSRTTLNVLVVIAVFLMVVAVGLSAYESTNPPPMTGHISEKVHHPASFPARNDTPWVYVLTITSKGGSRACTWTVDAETFERYSVGDQVKHWRK